MKETLFDSCVDLLQCSADGESLDVKEFTTRALPVGHQKDFQAKLILKGMEFLLLGSERVRDLCAFMEKLQAVRILDEEFATHLEPFRLLTDGISKTRSAPDLGGLKKALVQK